MRYSALHGEWFNLRSKLFAHTLVQQTLAPLPTTFPTSINSQYFQQSEIMNVPLQFAGAELVNSKSLTEVWNKLALHPPLPS